MSVNTSAPQTKVWIGGKEFSTCFYDLKLTDSFINNSGLVTCTGSLTLIQDPALDETLDDRVNFRFYRGQTIIVDTLGDTGEYERHPRGYLKILASKYVSASQSLTLDVGDDITLLNFQEPTDAKDTEIELGEEITSSQIIQRLLNKAGISQISGIMPNTRFNYQINLDGSYLSNVGKLLYAHNLFGWVDRFGTFRIESAAISPSSIGLVVVIGQDEVWYQPSVSAETTCEKIKVVGRGITVRPLYLRDETSEQYGPASMIDPNAGYSPLVIKKSQIKESWSQSSRTLTKEIRSWQPVGLIVPKDLQSSFGAKFTLVTSSIITEQSFYEVKGGKIIRREIREYEPQVKSTFEFLRVKKNVISNLTSIINSANTGIVYSYNSKDALQKIVLKSQETEGRILNGTDEDWSKHMFAPTGLRDSEYKVEEWQELSKGIWSYEYNTYKPLARVRTDLEESEEDNKLSLIYADGKEESGNAGQFAPSPPERHPPSFTTEEETLEEAVSFAVSFGVKPREKIISVDFLPSQMCPAVKRGSVEISGGVGHQQARQLLQDIARREGNLLLGRSKGYELAVRLSSQLTQNYRPLMTIQVVEQSGSNICYLGDAFSWVIGPNQAIAGCNGIFTGSFTDNKFTPAFRHTTLQVGVVGAKGDFKSFRHSLTPQVSLHTGQVGVGGSFSRGVVWELINWDNTSTSFWDLIRSGYSNPI